MLAFYMHQRAVISELTPSIHYKELALLGLPFVTVSHDAVEVSTGVRIVKFPALGSKLTVPILMVFTKQLRCIVGVSCCHICKPFSFIFSLIVGRC